MSVPRPVRTPLMALVIACAAAGSAAGDPPNPYSGFNLSGINYGSMQWERDQRAGKAVWPYFNTPAPSRRRTTGGAAGSATRGTTVRQGRLLRGRR